MNYEKIRQRPKQFLSVTSLKVEEFDYLLASFSGKWYNFYKVHTIQGKKRKSPCLKPHKDTKTLPTVSDKLFFILVYYKNGSLQEKLGAVPIAIGINFTQSQVSKWLSVLKPLFYDTLKSLNLLPARQGYKIADILEQLGEEKCFHDVTERLTNRPKDDETQQEFYSGKKKSHTIKNNVVSTESQYVVYLSSTYTGKTHDKKIADESEMKFPDNIHLFQDTGFQGYIPQNVHIVQPFKKPKNGELNELQIWFNKYVGRIRITSEHAIAGIKRLRIIKNKCRLFCLHKRDQIMEICVGLHNLRVTSPCRAYKSKIKWSL